MNILLGVILVALVLILIFLFGRLPNDSKLLSGRFMLTTVCAGVFGYCSIAKIIPVDAIVSIITMVFISYFQRQDRGKENGKPNP